MAGIERFNGEFDAVLDGAQSGAPWAPVVQPPVTVNLNAYAARTLAVYQLAVALAAAALFSVVPAVWDVVENPNRARSHTRP